MDKLELADQCEQASVDETLPRELFDAVGELALAIAPHNMDQDKRHKVRQALHVLVDHIIAVGDRRAILRASA